MPVTATPMTTAAAAICQATVKLSASQRAAHEATTAITTDTATSVGSIAS
jgi:hypothetical protein